MTLNVGDLAPNFELPDTELKLRTLEEFKGKKIVLSFIVAASSPVCEVELCTFRDSWQEISDMGAQIILCDPHRATVIGLNKQQVLRGIRMTSPDIRAGMALLIAALSAKGTSVIDNIDQIDRGYEKIDERLNALGAKITRI